MKKRLGKKTFDKESQQLHSVRHDHRRSVPLPMACGTLLQMDQAASSDKAFYRHYRERSEDPGLDRRLGIRVCDYRKEALEAGPKSLHNSTDSQRHLIRENAYSTGILSCGVR